MVDKLPERPTKLQFFKEYLDVSLSDDRMTAQMIYSIYPDAPLELSDFLDYFKSQGVIYGIKEDIVQSVCDNPSLFTGRALLIAEGLMPIHGKDAVIQWNFKPIVPFVEGESSENIKVDYKNIENVINVKGGELLATKTPFTEGTAGMNVSGNKIEARSGRNIPFKIGKNVVLDQTGLLAYATIDGQISITDKDKLNVFPIFEVKGNVDYSIGNIDFVGSVVIRGNVLAGFSVRAGGDLRVLGEVEGADLEAAGNIEIRAGVFGQGKGIVKAGNNLTASYLNQANVQAKNDVIIGSSMHSNIRAGNKVICRRGKGLIVGGRIQAGEMIDVNVIGNLGQTPTSVEVGISPELINEYNAIKERIFQIEGDLDKANKALSLLNRQLIQDKGYLPPDKMELRNNLSSAVHTLEKTIPDLEQRKNEIEERLELVGQAKIDVHNIAFPGTKVVFGKYVRFLNLEHSRISFRLSEGEIMTIPL